MTKFVQGIPEKHAENPRRVLMKRVSDGSNFVVLLMEGSPFPSIGQEKKYPYTEFVKEENKMKYYKEISAPTGTPPTFAPTEGEVTKDADEIPRVTCAVNSQETALYIAVEATKLMKDQMPELLEMTSGERIKKILPLAVDLATMGNMLFEKTQNQIDKMFSPGGDLG